MKTTICLLILILLPTPLLAGEIYKWIDDKGTIHFTDNPSKVPTEFKGKTDITTTALTIEEELAITVQRYDKALENKDLSPAERDKAFQVLEEKLELLKKKATTESNKKLKHIQLRGDERIKVLTENYEDTVKAIDRKAKRKAKADVQRVWSLWSGKEWGRLWKQGTMKSKSLYSRKAFALAPV